MISKRSLFLLFLSVGLGFGLSLMVKEILGTLGNSDLYELQAVRYRFLFAISIRSLIPWGLAALMIGFLSPSRKLAPLFGAVYGFVLSFNFLFSLSSGLNLKVLLFYASLGIFGAACGAVLGITGHLFRPRQL